MSPLDPQWIKRRNPVLRRLESNSVYTFLREYRPVRRRISLYIKEAPRNYAFMMIFVILLSSQIITLWQLLLIYGLLIGIDAVDRKRIGFWLFKKMESYRRFNFLSSSRMLYDPPVHREVLVDLWMAGHDGSDLIDVSFGEINTLRIWGEVLCYLIVLAAFSFALLINDDIVPHTILVYTGLLFLVAYSISFYSELFNFTRTSIEHQHTLIEWKSSSSSEVVSSRMAMMFTGMSGFIAAIIGVSIVGALLFLIATITFPDNFDALSSNQKMLWYGAVVYILYVVWKITNFRKKYLAGYRAYLKDRREFVRHFDVYIRKNLVEDPDWDRTP